MAGGFQASSRVVVVLEMSLFTQAAADIKQSQHLLSTVSRCGGEVAPSTAPVQAAADTLMVSTEEGSEVPCIRSVIILPADYDNVMYLGVASHHVEGVELVGGEVVHLDGGHLAVDLVLGREHVLGRLVAQHLGGSLRYGARYTTNPFQGTSKALQSLWPLASIQVRILERKFVKLSV